MGKLKPERIVMQTSMDEIMAKLLDGATKDACNLAVSTGHWPIALILASRISQEVYSDIVLQFAIKGVNSSANSSDWSIISLQILFAVMGGSDPVSSTLFLI